MVDTTRDTTGSLSHRELATLGFTLLLAVVLLLVSTTGQPQDYHAFADQRSLLGIRNAADVLSNLAFLAIGLLGLFRLRSAGSRLSRITRISLVALFAGLALTCFGSARYHLHPDDTTLVWDRLPMTIAFAGVSGAIVAQRISRRAGRSALLAMLVVGPASVLYWAATKDLAPYLVVQFGLAGGTLLLALLAPDPDDPFPWWALAVAYAVAKLAEIADVSIWNLTNGLVAGHTIKHLAAALGGLAIANALRPGKLAPP
jgi:hypothetical protein